MFKKEKGITLVALVVTIVVLLILAGVSISLVFSDTGLIKKSHEAKNAQYDAMQNELDTFNKLYTDIDTEVNKK